MKRAIERYRAEVTAKRRRTGADDEVAQRLRDLAVALGARKIKRWLMAN